MQEQQTPLSFSLSMGLHPRLNFLLLHFLPLSFHLSPIPSTLGRLQHLQPDEAQGQNKADAPLPLHAMTNVCMQQGLT